MVPTHTLNPLPFRPGVKRARVDQGPHSEAKHRNVGICALVATEESAPPKAQVHETAYCCLPSKNLREKRRFSRLVIHPPSAVRLGAEREQICRQCTVRNAG